VGFCAVRTERPYPPSSTNANSNFNFSNSSRFSSDICPFVLTVKVACDATKLVEGADPMNFDWLNSHSAPSHRLAELAASWAAIHIVDHFELTAACVERGARNSQRALIKDVLYASFNARTHGGVAVIPCVQATAFPSTL